MNGLEAIELMKQGKLVVSTDDVGDTYILKIINNNVCFKGVNDSDDEYQSDFAFNFSATYEEYIEPKPLTGWERVGEREKYFFPNIGGNIIFDVNVTNTLGEHLYNIANYFSTKEKAEEINFKQTLFRKLQRFSDENGGNEIDWKNEGVLKWYICFDYEFNFLKCNDMDIFRDFGQVYFVSREIAEKAIELFHDDLIKYFTGDFGGEK